MKTAKIIIRSISLECPECQAVVKGTRGGETLREDMADQWEQLASQSWQCPNCQKPFKLPANPFRKVEVQS